MNVAFIPVRGGSKSIPLKNIKPICGQPLVYWGLKAANASKYIDKIYVATDSELIRSVVEGFAFERVEVIDRSKESAEDTASTEFAMLEFAKNYEFDNIILIQATSPLLTTDDIDRGFQIYNDPQCDSVLSVVPQKRFYWKKENNGTINPINYDVYNRPRRQDFEGLMTENGAFYITSKKQLIKTENRVSGNIMAVEMSEDSYFEIDEPSDWIMIEELMKKNGMLEVPDLLDIKMFLTDSDGCLTDTGMYYTEFGDEIKKFSALDGMGFKLLREAGMITGIVTGENVELIRRRAKKLNVDILELGVHDKLKVLKDICNQYNISMNEIAYVGDDVNDLDCIKNVGFGCCVNNAMDQVKKHAKYVTKKSGGSGAVREVIDLILKYKNNP